MLTKRWDEDAAGRMLGPANMKVRLLGMLGYRVIWLSFDDVQKTAWRASHEADGLQLSNAHRREGAHYLKERVLQRMRDQSWAAGDTRTTRFLYEKSSDSE